jgi:EmrB/QacA subfamily drug resistance transporter
MDKENSVTFSLIKGLVRPMVAIIIGMFIVYLDQTVMNVILPRFIDDFHSSYKSAQWTITGYTLALAAVIPLAGWLSDRFGAKRIFLLTIGWFGAGSLLCALSTSIEQLVLFRIIQGVGGGMVTPIGLAMIYRLSPPGQTGKVMGMISIPILLAPAFGPVLAGYLADYVTWHWIFLINIPICIFGVLHGIRYLPSFERQSVARLDLLGFFLAPVAIASLCYGISSGGNDWSSIKTTAGLLTGVIALLLLIMAELRRPDPLLELRVYKSGDFTRGSLVLGAGQIAVFGTLYLLPQFLQNVRGCSASEAGLLMVPYAIASGIVLQWSGRWFDKFGVHRLAIVGLSGLAADGFWLSRLGPDTNIIWSIPPVILLGASTGLCMMPLSTSLLQTAPQHLVSRVSSLMGAVQQVMVSFTIAGLTTVLTSRLTVYAPSSSLSHTEAWLSAFRESFLVVMSIAILGVLMILMFRYVSSPTDKQK